MSDPMRLVCTLCGRETEIPRWQREYSPGSGHSPHICDTCAARVRHEAKRAQENPKPL